MKKTKKEGECPKQQILDPPTEKKDNAKINTEISLIDSHLGSTLMQPSPETHICCVLLTSPIHFYHNILNL